MVREPLDEKDDGGNAEEQEEGGMRPSLLMGERYWNFKRSGVLNILSHPVRRVLSAHQFHGEVEGAVDEDVDHDEVEDVGGGVGKRDVAVWLW